MDSFITRLDKFLVSRHPDWRPESASEVAADDGLLDGFPLPRQSS
jgi:hypothetical protein